MKNTGWGYDHFTASAWENREDMRAFVHTGAHLVAMRAMRDFATEVRTHSYEGTELPDWSEARRMLKESGKAFGSSRIEP